MIKFKERYKKLISKNITGHYHTPQKNAFVIVYLDYEESPYKNIFNYWKDHREYWRNELSSKDFEEVERKFF